MMNVLEFPLILQTRRNHGLEHATIHVLSEHVAGLRVAGRSQPNGFYLYGNLQTEDVTAAVAEALRRMQAGEHDLAVHPGCGTNLVASGLLAGGLAFAVTMLTPRRYRWYDRFPNAVLGGVIGTVLAKPLGPWLQANITTSSDMTGMRVRGITRNMMGPIVRHFVETELQ
jgi:Domain of unknown function (DUF6391)